jgi:hypothetical protein
MFATDEIKALAVSGKDTLANLDKVTAQAETAIAEWRLFLEAIKLIVNDASVHGITITIKKGTP